MSDRPLKVITILTGAIVIWIVFKIVEFIESMPQCSCSVPTQTLERIAFLEKGIIAIMAIGILSQLYNFNNSLNSTNEAMLSNPLHSILGVIGVVIYVFFIYNVNKFRTSIGKDCKCADKWEKIAMYVQALFYIIIFSLTVISTLFLLNVGMINMKTGIGRNILLITFSIVAVAMFSFFGENPNVFVDYVMEHVAKEGFECGGAQKKSQYL